MALELRFNPKPGKPSQVSFVGFFIGFFDRNSFIKKTSLNHS
jgi:hypothetical protein